MDRLKKGDVVALSELGTICREEVGNFDLDGEGALRGVCLHNQRASGDGRVISVQFNHWSPRFHSCGGDGKDGFCYNMPRYELRKIKNEMKW